MCPTPKVGTSGRRSMADAATRGRHRSPWRVPQLCHTPAGHAPQSSATTAPEFAHPARCLGQALTRDLTENPGTREAVCVAWLRVDLGPGPIGRIASHAA